MPNTRSSLTTIVGMAIAVAIAIAAGPLRADDAPATSEQRLQELDQKVKILERKAEIAAEAEAEKAKSGAGVTASAKDGFSLKSNDGNFTFKLRGYIHFDGRYYADDPQDKTIDTFILRRVRPIFEGTIYKRFSFKIMPDFGAGTTVLQEAYLDLKLSDAAVIRAGKFKPPLDLERLQSALDTTFVERALPTALLPNRDLGIQVGGQLAAGRLEYALGLFNGAVDGGNVDTDVNDGKDVVARLWTTPWKATPSPLAGLSFGLAASSGNQKGTLTATGLAGYRTAGAQTFFSYRSDATAAGTVVAAGQRFRIAPQATFYAGPFGFLAEYVRSQHEVRRNTTSATLDNTAWQTTAIWVLSGEPVSYRWYTPARPFDPTNPDETKRGWGGFALTARYNQFSADPDSFPTFAASTATQEAKGWAVGLDWTLQKQIRIVLDYETTTFDGVGAVRSDEKVLFTRFQIGW